MINVLYENNRLIYEIKYIRVDEQFTRFTTFIRFRKEYSSIYICVCIYPFYGKHRVVVFVRTPIIPLFEVGGGVRGWDVYKICSLSPHSKAIVFLKTPYL